MQLNKTLPKTATLIKDENKIISLFLKENPNETKDVCYCKECGKLLVQHNANFWLNKNGSLVSNLGNKTFLKTRNFGPNNTEYRLCRCDECIKKKFPSYNGKLCSTSAFYIKYAFGVRDEDFQFNVNKACVRNLSSFQKKYGEEDGKLKYKEYCKKQSVSNSFEYKKEKYGWNEEEFYEYNKSRAVTLSNLIKKYGEIEGTKRFEEYKRKQQYTMTLPYYIEKYGQDNGFLKYKEFISHLNSIGRTSNKSKEFFKRVFNENPKYKGLQFIPEHQIGPYFVDCYIPSLNLVIEYFGDYWHLNPSIYNDDYIHPIIKKKAKDIWKRDQIRLSYLKKFSNVIVVWEKDAEIFIKE